MKVSLVYLGALGDEHRHPRHAVPPLRAGYAASVLRAGGHDVELVDTAAPLLSDTALVSAMARRRPDVLLLDPRVENVGRVAALGERLAPHAGRIALVGPPAEASRAELLGRGTPFAGVLGGEYEGAVVEAVLGLGSSGGSELHGLAGWSRPGPLGVREGPAPEPIADLDALPFPPHHDFLASGGYELGYPIQQRDKLRTAYVLSTRGCPYACTFCSPVEMRSRFLRYRARDVRSVADELEWVRRLGANTVYFIDDNFLRQRDRVASLCEEMIRRRLDLRWIVDCRVDDVDPSLLPLLRRAGCSTLCLGVESGSQRVLDSIQKGITVEQTFRAARAIRDAGLWTVMYVIVGSPTETPAERIATWRMLEELRPEMVQIHRFARYPMARGERSLGDAWRAPGDKFVGSDGAGAEPLELDQQDLYRRYYLSARFVTDYLRTRGPYFPGPMLRDGRLALRTLSFLLRPT